jgi:hypothetical protein
MGPGRKRRMVRKSDQADIALPKRSYAGLLE